MQHLFVLADKIPWVMAPAIVIGVTIVISVVMVVVRYLEPASKAMILALMMGMGAWAVVLRAL